MEVEAADVSAREAEAAWLEMDLREGGASGRTGTSAGRLVEAIVKG